MKNCSSVLGAISLSASRRGTTTASLSSKTTSEYESCFRNRSSSFQMTKHALA